MCNNRDMKKLILILFCTFGFFALKAQSNHVWKRTLIKTFDHSEEKIEGTPYFTEDFKPGTLMVEGKEPIPVFLRYNVSKEQMEIKTELKSDKTYIFSGNKAEYSINSVTYLLDKIYFEGNPIYGYFLEYYNKNGLRLLLKPTVIFIPASEAKTGYEEDEPARIEMDQEYYIVFEDGRVENVRMKNRDIRKIFATKASRKYLSDNDIDTVEDLVSFLEFHNQL